MFSYKSEKPSFSEKIKQELQREEKPKSNSYTLVLLLTLLVVALIFFLVALLRNCGSEEVSETAKSTPAVEETTTPVAQTGSTVENPSEEAASETTATAPAGGQNYTVQSGDTLFEIGQKFGVDWKKIAEINNLEAPYSLTVGKTLLIPEKTSSTE